MAFLRSQAVELTGGCHCQAIRYAINIPALVDRPIVESFKTWDPRKREYLEFRLPTCVIDHCTDCRVSSGGLIQAWLIFPEDWFSIVLTRIEGDKSPFKFSNFDAIFPSSKMQQEFYIRSYSATKGKIRTFCGNCGTTIAYARTERDPSGQILDVSLGTLDEKFLQWNDLAPDRHVWWNKAGSIPWLRDLFSGVERNIVRHPTGDPSEICEDWNAQQKARDYR